MIHIFQASSVAHAVLEGKEDSIEYVEDFTLVFEEETSESESETSTPIQYPHHSEFISDFNKETNEDQIALNTTQLFHGQISSCGLYLTASHI